MYEVLERKGGDDGVVYDVRKVGRPAERVRAVGRNSVTILH